MLVSMVAKIAERKSTRTAFYWLLNATYVDATISQSQIPRFPDSHVNNNQEERIFQIYAVAYQEHA